MLKNFKSLTKVLMACLATGCGDEKPAPTEASIHLCRCAWTCNGNQQSLDIRTCEPPIELALRVPDIEASCEASLQNECAASSCTCTCVDQEEACRLVQPDAGPPTPDAGPMFWQHLCKTTATCDGISFPLEDRMICDTIEGVANGIAEVELACSETQVEGCQTVSCDMECTNLQEACTE